MSKKQKKARNLEKPSTHTISMAQVRDKIKEEPGYKNIYEMVEIKTTELMMRHIASKGSEDLQLIFTMKGDGSCSLKVDKFVEAEVQKAS